MQAFFFRRLGKNLICQEIQKLEFSPKNSISKGKNSIFADNFSIIWPLLHHKIAMNSKISQKKLISDLKTCQKRKKLNSKMQKLD